MTARRDPRFNSATRDGRMLAATKRELQSRLGPSPSFEAREVADQIIRAKLDIAELERKRVIDGGLSTLDRETLIRRENALTRAMLCLERLAPLPRNKLPSLADTLAAERRAREQVAA